MASYYDILGVARSANLNQIADAFRLLAFSNHPEAPEGNVQRFVRLAEAYNVLSDPARRQAYDEGNVRVRLTEGQAMDLFQGLLQDWQQWLGVFLQQNPSGAGWLAAGTFGGAALGATIAGPPGALVLGAIGLACGGVRAVTNKSIAQHWSDLSPDRRREAFEAIATTLGSGAAGATAGQHQSTSASSDDLSEAELRGISGTPAGSGEAECKVCLTNSITLVNKPCKHACLCASCFVALRERDATPHCPVCRAPIYHVARVYL